MRRLWTQTGEAGDEEPGAREGGEKSHEKCDEVGFDVWVPLKQLRGVGVAEKAAGAAGLHSKAARQEGLLVLWRGLLPRLLLKGCGSSIGTRRQSK